MNSRVYAWQSMRHRSQLYFKNIKGGCTFEDNNNKDNNNIFATIFGKKTNYMCSRNNFNIVLLIIQGLNDSTIKNLIMHVVDVGIVLTLQTSFENDKHVHCWCILFW